MGDAYADIPKTGGDVAKALATPTNTTPDADRPLCCGRAANPLNSIFYQGYTQGYMGRNTICVYVWVYLGKKKGLNP